ncbi:hypothetical protein B9T21_09950 [Wohlfahrtiimonas chitiniclastica]|uniref:hypothetical protein n=1 Tax=Wohlfahrtiimonas chitiniclastica TaxID=400946 RepID=UPI000B983603|nr:hypothetical protein [Wohlfahrtiimonas chitiniclastica]OYQ84403.1 hypothetical protein B9T21_09950 [Wohlfahrtiimonas chitiniclastica]
MSKKLKFEVYRYQLLPKTQKQQDLFGNRLTPEQLRERKNAILDDIITEIKSWKSDRYDLNSEVLHHEEDWYIFRLARKKDIKIETRNFSEQELDKWPRVIVIINNNPLVQTICISINTDAFSSTSQVVNIINHNISSKLNSLGLIIEISPTFYEQDFWSMIKESEGNICSLRFEFISPNMSNISKSLMLDLREARDKYNSQKTVVEFSVDKNINDASLDIDPSDVEIRDMVDYASEGGGDVSIKTKNGRTSKMKNNTRKFELDVDFNSMQSKLWPQTITNLLNILKSVVKQ